MKTIAATVGPAGPVPRIAAVLWWMVVLLWLTESTSAFLGPFSDKIQGDFQALTRRVTARHILLPPNMDLALTLKQKNRQRLLVDETETTQMETTNQESPPFVIDIFEQAAQKYSRDETTNQRGGLIGELVPQGYCSCPELDQACFEVRLGIVEGPIASPYGYHLILVSERTNCPKLDGSQTKLVPGGTNGGQLVSSTDGQPSWGRIVLDQVALWVFAIVAGGIVAEDAARISEGLP